MNIKHCNRLIFLNDIELKYDENKCSICYESYDDGDKLIILKCNHNYHETCINSWIKKCKSCPICRIGINVDEKHEFMWINNKENIKFFINLSSCDGIISFRKIDYFVSRYSKEKNLEIYDLYKQALFTYTKKNFDVFQRGTKFDIDCIDDKQITTTSGQLNFFEWFFNNNLDKKIMEEYDNVTENMNNYKNKLKHW